MLSSAGVTDTAPQLTGAPAADKVAMSEEAGDEPTRDPSPGDEPREGEGAPDGTLDSPEGSGDGEGAQKTSLKDSVLDGITELPPITLDDAGPALSHLSKGAKHIPTKVSSKSGRTKAPKGRRAPSREQRKANIPKQVVLPVIEDQDEVQRRYFCWTGLTLTFAPNQSEP